VPSLVELNADVAAVKAGLRGAGIPSALLESIATRALRSQRRTTGAFQSNRQSRWTLQALDPQFGTEEDCKSIYLRLLGMMCEFKNAPSIDGVTSLILSKYIGHEPQPGTYSDALTLEHLDYNEMLAQVVTPVHGRSDFHIGHDDPTAVPKHTPANISWRGHRSNLIQGDMTLSESRTKLVELIARYFQLGEVSILPDP
jgi:hypothetical protein